MIGVAHPRSPDREHVVTASSDGAAPTFRKLITATAGATNHGWGRSKFTLNPPGAACLHMCPH